MTDHSALRADLANQRHETEVALGDISRELEAHDSRKDSPLPDRGAETATLLLARVLASSALVNLTALEEREAQWAVDQTARTAEQGQRERLLQTLPSGSLDRVRHLLLEEDRLAWALSRRRGHDGGPTHEDEADARAIAYDVAPEGD